MNGVILLLTDMMFHTTTVVVIVAATCALFAWLWFGLAWTRLASGKRDW
jgi:hypothetical protein